MYYSKKRGKGHYYNDRKSNKKLLSILFETIKDSDAKKMHSGFRMIPCIFFPAIIAKITKVNQLRCVKCLSLKVTRDRHKMSFIVTCIYKMLDDALGHEFHSKEEKLKL